MAAILGIDAAWTSKQPSGLAIGVKDAARWELIGAFKSYADFFDDPTRTDAAPSAEDLLARAGELAAQKISLVTVDMPLANEAITGRRAADNAVSCAYGAKKASTHTPSSERPGRISSELMTGLDAAGYPLQTSSVGLPGTIEVYPHPALIELMQASERLKYKFSKIRKYWPNLDPAQRRQKLVDTWKSIVEQLEHRLLGIRETLPMISPNATARELKAYEDMLDAIVCVWVGIETIEARATPYGDEASAIWIPNPRP